MEKHYRICFNNICIDTPLELNSDENSLPFECEFSKADITVRFTVADKLPKFGQATVLGTAGNIKVSSFGDKILRENAMGTAEGTLLSYSNNNPSECISYFTHQSFRTLTDSRYFWNSIALSQLLLAGKALILHASYIDIGGKALLFSAPCGTGKSTQAALWEKYGNAEIINGDKAGISVSGGKIWAHGVPFCGTSGICKNRSIPLGGIVFLSQAKENSVRRVSGVEAVKSIMQNTYLDFLAPDEQLMCVDLIIEILSGVPVYHLSCTPDEKAVIALENEIKNGGMI